MYHINTWLDRQAKNKKICPAWVSIKGPHNSCGPSTATIPISLWLPLQWTYRMKGITS